MPDRDPLSLQVSGATVLVDGQEVARGIDLRVPPGELLVVLGLPGSGKSGLLGAIAGLATLTSGRILFDDRDVTRVAARRRQAAMLTQDYPLWPHLDVGENVALAIGQRALSAAQRAEHIAASLAHVGLQEFRRHRPGQLTPSQRQRVALARTLLADARVLLLDEPFATCGAPLRARLPWLVRQRQQQLGATMLLATDDAQLGLRIADRIAILHAGDLLQTGTPAEIYDMPANRRVATTLGDMNLLDGEIEIVGGQAMFKVDDDIVIPLLDHAVVRPRAGTAMFRPHHLRLLTGDQPAIGNMLRLAGRVDEIELLGNQLRYRIDLAGRFVWSDVARDTPTRLPGVGDTVSVGLDPSHVRVLEP